MTFDDVKKRHVDPSASDSDTRWMKQNRLSKPANTARRCCNDCSFLWVAVSWWCMNKDAVRDRQTAIPGISNCPYWEAAKLGTFAAVAIKMRKIFSIFKGRKKR